MSSWASKILRPLQAQECVDSLAKELAEVIDALFEKGVESVGFRMTAVRPNGARLRWSEERWMAPSLEKIENESEGCLALDDAKSNWRNLIFPSSGTDYVAFQLSTKKAVKQGPRRVVDSKIWR